MEKTGDFREGESRSDSDMTKKGEVWDGFTVTDKDSIKKGEYVVGVDWGKSDKPLAD